MTADRKLIWIRFALVTSGLLLLAPPWQDWLLKLLPVPWSESISGVFKGIGEAFLVALLLELLVDPRLKRKLVMEIYPEIIEDVAQRTLSRLLPSNIFQHIEEQVLRAHIVRRSWNITYWISPIEKRPDYVRLVTESKYEMANVAPSKTTYPAVYEVEKALFTDVGATDITEVTVRNLLKPAGDQNVVFRYPGNADPEDAPRVAGDYIVFSKSFDLPVHQTRAALQFVFRSTEYFHVGSIVPFFAKYLVELTTLRVIYPKDKLRVIVDFPANKDSELQPPGGRAGDDSYVFPMPILPGQGFTVRFPKCQ